MQYYNTILYYIIARRHPRVPTAPPAPSSAETGGGGVARHVLAPGPGRALSGRLPLLSSETGRWLSTEDHIVRDVRCCAFCAGDLAALPIGSN